MVNYSTAFAEFLSEFTSSRWDLTYELTGKVMSAKKTLPGLFPADRPKPVVIETSDNLFKSAVTWCGVLV